MWPSAKINHAARETFVHRHKRFAGEWIFRMKSKTVTANSFFIAQRSRESLSEREAAIFHGVMRVHFQIALAFQLQVNDGVFGEQRKHVIEKWNSGLDGRFALAVEVEVDGNFGFLCVARDFC